MGGTPEASGSDRAGQRFSGESAQWLALALQHHQAGRRAEAEGLYRRILAGVTGDGERASCLLLLGMLAQEAGALETAAAWIGQAIELQGNVAFFHQKLGEVRFAGGRTAPAAEAYRRALALKPDQAEVRNNLGNVLKAEGRLEAAVACYRRAAALDPGFAEAYSNLGNTLMDQARIPAAMLSYRRALAVRPSHAVVHSNLLFALCFDETSDPGAVFREHLAFDRVQIRPRAPGVAAHPNARDPGRRLRVGYLSPDFRLHPGGHFLLPVIAEHDRGGFEVFCYANHAAADELTREFQRHADHWRFCFSLADSELAAAVRADGIDILVECAGHMQDNRLLLTGLRPAPVQVSYPLYPNTTGVSAIDYRIMDCYFAPPWADAWHSEALVRLPDAHVCYRPHRTDIEPSPAPPCLDNGYVTFGSFNNFAKVGAATVALWARLLKAVPDSRLILKWRGLGLGGGEDWCHRRFAGHDIAPGRVILTDHSPDPYTPYRELDLCLDPLFANGGTTTCDALWMGVPVVTLSGRTAFSRVGLCHLTNLGLPGLIAADADDYVAIAAGLARDRGALTGVRRGLRARFAASPLMDAPRYTRHLESAYRIMWRRWCAGEPVAPITIAPERPAPAVSAPGD
jgi:predicted O-linked N-acetylglucosamine transferase (SPINDLY family)